MTKVGWLSYADACNPNKDKEIENDLERQSNYYEANVYIQNPGNKRTLDELNCWKSGNVWCFAQTAIESITTNENS